MQENDEKIFPTVFLLSKLQGLGITGEKKISEKKGRTKDVFCFAKNLEVILYPYLANG